MEAYHHSRISFERELQQLEHDLLEMGARAESMVVKAVDSLVLLDSGLAHEVMESDDELDAQDLVIENSCLRMLALQAPMARDLRTIGTAMKMVTDLERVGDLAVDVAKISLKIVAELGSTDFIDVRSMSNVALAMLRESLQAFVNRDLDLVREVCEKDDLVDQAYRDLRGQIHTYMRSNPEADVAASWLLLAIHHLERIADHAVNIAERVNFVVTGKLESLSKHRP
jgi:phosphate transport system protein